jgi:hypothetical protein
VLVFYGVPNRITSLYKDTLVDEITIQLSDVNFKTHLVQFEKLSYTINSDEFPLQAKQLPAVSALDFTFLSLPSSLGIIPNINPLEYCTKWSKK